MRDVLRIFVAPQTAKPRCVNRLFIWRTLLVVAWVVLGSAPSVFACDVLARTADFVITDCDLERWRPVLEARRDLRSELRDVARATDRSLEEIALARILLAEHSFRISAAEVIEIWERQTARRVVSTYVEDVLEAQIEVSEQEVRSAYQEWRTNFRTSDSAVVHEIFRWGPRDLPELRHEQRELLERLRAEIRAFEEFKLAAAEYSDSTSALANGSLGHLRRSSLTSDLERILFAGEIGITEVVETKDGLYLFFVSSRQPARNRFEDVEDEIISRLRRDRLNDLREADFKALAREYDLELPSANAAGQDGVAFLLPGKPVSLVGGAQPVSGAKSRETRINRQARAVVYRRELEAMGRCPADDRVEEFENSLARVVFKKLLAHEWAVCDRSVLEAEAKASIVNPPGLERWTVEILTCSAAGHPRLFFDLLRLLHDLGMSVPLESAARAIEAQFAVTTKLETYDDVPMRQVAGLGPEIYNTVRYRLSPGEMSRPLVLAGGERIALVRLEARRDDEEATRIALNSRVSKEARQTLGERLRRELLRAHGFSVAW